jgi:uncharacterized membrane protein YkoI
MTGRTKIVLVVLTALLGASDLAVADDKHKRKYDRKTEIMVDQDEVLAAVKRGEIRPMSESLAVAEKNMPGQVIGVAAKRLSGLLVYEFKIITPGGRLREIYIDAATLDIAKVE